MSESFIKPQERLTTGIDGLDVVLDGGWPPVGSYLIQGDAGAGKTTTGMHFLREGAACGERCAIISLSESEAELRKSAASHGWKLDGIEIVDLSDRQAGSNSSGDYSVFSADEVELNEVMARIREAVEQIKPARLVLDPISGIRTLSGNATRFRQQVLGLKDFLRMQGVTALILSDTAGGETHAYLETAVSGVLWLRQEIGEFGDTRRFLRIQKLRGATYQTGEHPFHLETGGMVIFPRLGSEPSPKNGAGAALGSNGGEVMSSGVAGLDVLLGGGVESGSVTVISGQSGIGKTTTALQFLVEAARNGKMCQAFSIDESATSMVHRADSLGLPASEVLRAGRLKIQRVRSTQIYAAEFARLVQSSVDDDGAQVVMIDSLTGYRAGVSGEAHLVYHLTQLLEYLSHANVTVFLTLESSELTNFSVSDPFGMSYLSDNSVLLRFFEAAGEVRRAISVLKKRSGPHESSIREFQFTPRGIRIGEPLTDFNGVLNGTPEYIGGSGELLPPKNHDQAVD